MTANDLKTLASRDLEGLPPMPSVVPDVLAEGARRQRRRRTVGAGLAAASVIGVVAIGTAVLPGTAESGSPAPRTTSGVASSSGPITETKGEFAEWAARKFSEALPERFAPVQPTEQHDFVTHVGGVRVDFNLNVTLTDRARSDLGPEDTDLIPDCAGGGPGVTCAERPEQNAIAYHEMTDDSYPYAGMEMSVHDRTEAADTVHLNFFGERYSGTPVPLTDQEILALAGSPQFEQIWREVTAHPAWVSSGVNMRL